MLSVIIPSRYERWLDKTIPDILSKAEGEIEIIVVLDGYWPNPLPSTDKRVRYLHQGMIQDNHGLRDAVNAGVAISRGEYIMKIDGHCMVDQGFDTKLIADCEDDWVVVPRRHRLDADEWKLVEDGRPPVDYMFLAYPYERKWDMTCGLHGDIWKEWNANRKEEIDDLMTFQGSCYFMKKSYWVDMDSSKYGIFTHESQEISMRVWLSGGRVVVNKKTWYAHLHKGKKHGTGYNFSNAQWANWAKSHEQGRRYAIDYWMTTKDYKYDMEWLIEKFWPVPTWPDDWKTRIKEDEKYDFRYSEEGKKLL